MPSLQDRNRIRCMSFYFSEVHMLIIEGSSTVREAVSWGHFLLIDPPFPSNRSFSVRIGLSSFWNFLECVWRRVQLKCDGIRWRKEGEVKWKLVNGVGSQVPFSLPRNMVYPALLPLMRTPRLPAVDNWRPYRFKWTRPLRRKTKSGFCACAITFQTHATLLWAVCAEAAASQLLVFLVA